MLMISQFLTSLFSAPKALPAEEIPYPTVFFELIVAFVLVVLMFVFRTRLLKVICGCGAEVCLFLACKLFFGNDSIVTQIMCWVTAAVACVFTVSVVSRINWGNLRGRPGR